MEKLEMELKSRIIESYGSLSKFAEKIEMPWTTLDSVLKRGINNSNISNIIKICKELRISADALAEGRIASLAASNDIATINDPDIRRIQRARKSMPIEDKNLMMEFLERSFREYFEDDGSDDPD